jgi:biopolymer transport protein ExbB
MFAEFDWLGALRGSPIMIALVGCSIVALAIALERIFYFRQRAGDADGLLVRVLSQVKQGRFAEAAGTCQASHHPLGPVALEILRSPDPRDAEVEERLQIALSGQKLLLERNLGTLGTLAAVAPLIGLLGTVWGIMRAFHDMALTGSAAPSVVAAGVAEALLTTAAGLVIAVPAVMLYNQLTRRLNVMLTVAENHSRTLRAQLARVRRSRTDSSDVGDDLHSTSGQDELADLASELSAEPVGNLS